MYVEDAFNRFIEDRKTFCSFSTIDYYRENLHRFISFLDRRDVQEIEQLTQEDLKQYLLFLRSLNVKNTTIHCYFRAINAFCYFLIDQEYIPYFRYKVRLPRPDPDPVLPLTAVEADHLISVIKLTSDPEFCKRDLLIIRLMLDLGLRSSEVRHLKKSDILCDRIQIVNSKCNKSRVLPLPETIKDLLLDYDLTRFRSNDFIINISENGLKHLFQRIKKKSQISRIHAHLLRHTFATSYMLYRRNIEYLRIYLGHEDYTTTKYYVHLADQCFLTNYDIYKISDVFR